MYFSVLMSKCFHMKMMSESYEGSCRTCCPGRWSLGQLGAAHQGGACRSCSASGSCLEGKHCLTSHAASKNMAVKELGLCCFKYQLDQRSLAYFIKIRGQYRATLRRNSHQGGPEVTPLAWVLAPHSLAPHSLAPHLAVRFLRGGKVFRTRGVD